MKKIIPIYREISSQRQIVAPADMWDVIADRVLSVIDELEKHEREEEEPERWDGMD